MLIATDLDGTLIPLHSKEPSPYTAQVLERVDHAGIPVVFVTGRPLRWMEGLWPHVGEHGMAIVSNGAIVYDVHNRTAISTNGIEPEAGLDLIKRIVDAVPGATFAVECLDGIRREPRFKEYLRVPSAAPVGPLEEIWDAPAVKVLVRHESGTADYRDAVIAAVGDTATATWSEPELVEISLGGVTKASALLELCDRLGVGADEVVAFGDMPNDLPMLTWAGTSYAIADAHPDVLAAADHVAPPSDEDGVAKVLESLLEEHRDGRL